MSTLVWFRNDLRVGDNPALQRAAAAGAPIAGLYIREPADRGPRLLGGAANWKLHGALEALAADLTALNAPLLLMSGAARDVVPQVAASVRADAVFWNRRYEPAAAAVDRDVKSALKGRGVHVESFGGGALVEPFEVKTAAGGAYKVFTPFCKAARARAVDLTPLSRPRPFPRWASRPNFGEALDGWKLRPTAPDWAGGLKATWRHGETAALQRLDAFIAGGFNGYRDGRNFPATPHVSALSPHLRFGEIGPRQARQAAWTAAAQGAGGRDADFEAFERELYWRDFSTNLLFHADDLANANHQAKFDEFPWRDDSAGLKAWREGRTGYPIVDAGMRQLWRTGWMHNRVRMIAASFLTKHLMIDWRQGERWFWDTLVDADAASNPANWQWVAGSGADAAPYFRIFNPMTQGQKLDPDGAYVRRWAPELSGLPDKHIHAPWAADAAALRSAGVALGQEYPAPIVDHKAARERALSAFKALS